MENRKRMGGKIKGCRERGEWAELYFMMLALEKDMKVSRPFGLAGRYDVGVESERGVVRVQVKSTIYKRRGDGYSLNVMGPKRKKYVPGTVDFFAILLIPIDDWYIIPFEVMGRKNSSLHFTPKSKRQKYGRYREAWELLRGDKGLTIWACWDEGKGIPRLRGILRYTDDPASLGMTGRDRSPQKS
jgi:hypothetical protein